MRLEFPQVDEIPLLVKLVSVGEQDIFPVQTLDQVLFAAGVFFVVGPNQESPLAPIPLPWFS